MAGDGSVPRQTIVKGHARKIRRIADSGIVAGFAGASADAFTLLDRFEAKLKSIGEAWRGPRWNLRRLADRSIPEAPRGDAGGDGPAKHAAPLGNR